MFEISESTKTELINKVLNKPATFKNKACRITAINNVLTLSDRCDQAVTLTFEDNSTKMIGLLTAVSSGNLVIDEDISVITAAFDSLSSEKLEEDKKKSEELLAKWAAEKKAAEEAKAAEKEKTKRAKQLSSLDDLQYSRLTQSQETYMALGWILRHVTSISACLPDYMESWFVKNFPNSEYSLVDSKKKTSGGYSMKFTSSFYLTVDKGTSGIALIDEKLKSKRFCDTEFIYNIVSKYGFKFGSEQDEDAVRFEIPADYLEDFEKGYEM